MVFLLCAALLIPQAALAQVKWQENFNYPEGNLYGQGAWGKYGSNPDDPIQVTSTTLAYEGYPGGVQGKSVHLGPNAMAEDLLVRVVDDENGLLTGTLYYSALIQVNEPPTGAGYVMSLLPRTKNSVVKDGTSPTELGRLFINKGEADGTFKVGVERGGSNPVYAEGEYAKGTTLLVVVKYAIKDTQVGDGSTDIVTLYINPASYTEEPATPAAQTNINTTGSKLGNYGLQGFELRQCGKSTAAAPDMLVGMLRVATDYASLFSTEGEGGGESGGGSEEPKPEITYTASALDLGHPFEGIAQNIQFHIKAANLTSDITVTPQGTELTSQVSTISAADAQSAEGYMLPLTLCAAQGSTGSGSIVLSSEGMDDVTLTFKWESTPVTQVSTLAELNNGVGETFYLYTGEAVVSFVDAAVNSVVYYLQDATGGMALKDLYTVTKTTLQQGDKVTGIVGEIINSFGVKNFQPWLPHIGTVLSQNNTVEPVQATLRDIKQAPQTYINRLVHVSHVTLTTTDDTFAEGMTQPVMHDGTEEGKMRIFKQTSLIGTSIPTEAAEVVGLSTSMSAVIIGPRSADDVWVPAGEPSIEVTPTTLPMIEGQVGASNQVGTLHISARHLPGDVTIEVTGTNRSLFTTSVATISAGSSETDVVITYQPDAVGKHSARIFIDCPAAPQLSQSITLSAYAIDPANPSSIEANPVSLAAFQAKVGETHEQTLTVTTVNLPDYAYVRLATPGAFRLSTGMLLKQAETPITVTFAPTEAGEYSNEIIITSLGMVDIHIPLTGTATGSQEEGDKEGDSLPLDDSAPLTLMQQHFDTVEKNKPLALEGWKNIAEVGNRAWWGYEFGDTDASQGEKTAKVTAYDSFVNEGDEKPAQMMLVTPALDFKNAASRMFTFRVRGDYLRNEQADRLELCYIDLAEGNMYVAPVEGFQMPCTQDESGEWFEYHIDLDGQSLADKFFMAFRFTGERGRTSSATYYIDDVTYGRTDIPLMRLSANSLAFEAYPGTDALSTTVSVSTENLAEPITLTLGGANKSKFALTTSTLPAEGGNFAVKFNSDDEGVHEAYVKLASRGAADQYLELSVNNTTQTGIASLGTDAADYTVYDHAGRLVRNLRGVSAAQATASLPAGLYVVQKRTPQHISTSKIMLP